MSYELCATSFQCACPFQSNLARLNLPHPEAVFEINFFRRNPVPCKCPSNLISSILKIICPFTVYTLAHELYPGKYRPTIAHSFIRLLSEKGLLHTCFTQNIDTLERRAGVPDGKVIEAHGSFASQRCIVCHKKYDDEKMKQHILQKKIAKCESCGGYVKPDIVFFGEAVSFFRLSVTKKIKRAHRKNCSSRRTSYTPSRICEKRTCSLSWGHHSPSSHSRL
jgi:NAD-dependent SIR2 family protein deacetylase